MQSTGTRAGFLKTPPERPDPVRPAFLYRYNNANACTQGKRWISHQQRRSTILAAVRKLIIDVGGDGICFNAIAVQCGITVPTIYNIVGNRKCVIDDASAEWVQWLATAAEALGERRSSILAVLEAFWASGPDYPEFSINAAKMMATPGTPFTGVFQKPGYTVVRNLLADLQAHDRLRVSVAVDRLAWHLIQSVHVGVSNWTLAPYDTKRFRREFTDGPGLMLLGAVRGEEYQKIEQDLDSILLA